jgi:hypothetical protein
VLLAIAGGVFVAASTAIVLRQAALFTLVMLAGAVAFAASNLGWALGISVDRLVLGWAAFLVLTIAGERLELSRLSSPPRGAAWSFGAIVAVLAAGSAITVTEPTLGQRLAGAALIGLALWLARYDLARRTLRTSGLPRYAAASVLAGYLWLAVSGATFVIAAPLSAGPLYDAALHALFLGFVFSMVFGHAPIILPAVLRIELPFHRALYAPLVLLHASVALRVAADWLALPGLRGLGGVLNAASLLVFVLSVVGSKLFARRAARSAPTARAAHVRLLALLALAFGVVTVIEGGRTLFDPTVRAAAEPVVPFVLGFNFAAGFAYVAAAVGLWRARRWGAALAVVLALSTLLVFALFGVHVAAGGAFASRTPVALAIRSAFWCIAAAASCRALGCFRRSVA